MENEDNYFVLCNNYAINKTRSNSSEVLIEDTAISDELCSHRKISAFPYVDDNVIKKLKKHKKEIKILKQLSSILKKYCMKKEHLDFIIAYNILIKNKNIYKKDQLGVVPFKSNYKYYISN